ncbi:hypothetical protein RI367_001369 [Sorochytrium milnesiophthora]
MGTKVSLFPDTSAFPYLSLVIIAYLWGSFAALWHQRHSAYIQKRHPTLLLLYTIACTPLSVNFLLNTFWAVYRTESEAAFYAELVVQYMFEPLFHLTFILRAVILLNEFHVNNSLLHQSMGAKSTVRPAHTTGIERLAFRTFRGRHPAMPGSVDNDHFRGVHISDEVLWKLAFLVSAVCLVVLILVLAGIGDLFRFHPETSCLLTRWVVCMVFDFLSKAPLLTIRVQPLYIFFTVYLLTNPFFLHATRKVQDSYYLRWEYTGSIILCYVFFGLYITGAFWPAFAAAIERGGLECDMFLLLLMISCHTLLVLAPAIHSMRYEKQRVSTLSNLSITGFTKLLVDDIVWSDFKQFLAKDFCMENGYFVEQMMLLHQSPVYQQARADALAQRSFSSSLNTDAQDGLSTSNLAKIFAESTAQLPSSRRGSMDVLITHAEFGFKIKDIYEQFIAPNSPYELNIPASTREVIAQQVKCGNYPADLLDGALVEEAGLRVRFTGQYYEVGVRWCDAKLITYCMSKSSRIGDMVGAASPNECETELDAARLAAGGALLGFSLTRGRASLLAVAPKIFYTRNCRPGTRVIYIAPIDLNCSLQNATSCAMPQSDQVDLVLRSRLAVDTPEAIRAIFRKPMAELLTSSKSAAEITTMQYGIKTPNYVMPKKGYYANLFGQKFALVHDAGAAIPATTNGSTQCSTHLRITQYPTCDDRRGIEW